MVQYKIYVGLSDDHGHDYHEDEVYDIAAKYLSAFTSTLGTGYYEGKREISVIIEYYSNRPVVDDVKVRQLVRKLITTLNQKSVLVIKSLVMSELIEENRA